jgi:uncharacterized membrane protein
MIGALFPIMFLGAALALYAVFIGWVLMFAICGVKWAQNYWRELQ